MKASSDLAIEDVPEDLGLSEPMSEADRGSGGSKRRQVIETAAIQLLILAGAVAAWEYLPRSVWIRERVGILDPYFISSPSLIWERLGQLFTGSDGVPEVWPYFFATAGASLIGTVVGASLGAAAGLVLSNSPSLNRILRPFIIGLNAVPRIALIPVIVIIAGPTLKASIITVVTVTFFIVFFSAYEGGRSVAPHVLQNAKILGGSKAQVMWHVRARYVLAWTVTTLPNAVSFGLVSAVTAEILTGTFGLGRLLLVSIQLVDSTLTFAVVVILTIFGVALVGLTDVVQRRWLRWWAKG